MESRILRLHKEPIPPVKIGNINSVGPFVTATNDEYGKPLLHVIVCLNSSVPEDVKIELKETTEDSMPTYILELPKGSDIASYEQIFWSIIIGPIKESSDATVQVLFNFNEKDLGEPKRRTKVILP